MATQSVQQRPADQRVRPLAVVTPPPVRVEPPGPRAVALALVRLGLVSGKASKWKIEGADECLAVRVALTALATEKAIEPVPGGPHRLTEYGDALYGPDLRQRGWVTTR